MTLQPEEDNNWDQIETLAHNYAAGQAALQELAILKPVLALAISKLPKQQLKLSLTDQAKLDKPELELQMKQESKSGALLFRVVKA